MFIGRRKRKKIDTTWVYVLTMCANNQTFVDSLDDGRKQRLKELIKELQPEDCMCCPCFAWEFSDNKREIIGQKCTLGWIANTFGKGTCNFD